ncbi:MAG: hypothetical protein P8X61_12540, partial [Limibacillus sp.]
MKIFTIQMVNCTARKVIYPTTKIVKFGGEMTPTRLKRLSLLEQVDLLDGERIAELLLAPGSGADNPGLLALSRELLRRQRSEGA